MKKDINRYTIVTAIFAILVIFSNCGSLQEKDSIEFVKNPPFKILEVYSQKWVAGIEEAGSGTNFHILFNEIKKGVSIEKIFFRKNDIILIPSLKNSNSFVASINHNTKRDIIMDSNPINEAKNTPPMPFQFDLKDNEAILQYKIKDKIKFYKILNVSEKPILAYPQSNKN